MSKKITANEDSGGNSLGEITKTRVDNKEALDVISLPGASHALAFDTTSTPSTCYLGYAAIGSATSAAVWHIYKVDTTTGLQTFADSNNLFDNVWDDRASLTYG